MDKAREDEYKIEVMRLINTLYNSLYAWRGEEKGQYVCCAGYRLTPDHEGLDDDFKSAVNNWMPSIIRMLNDKVGEIGYTIKDGKIIVEVVEK